MSMKLQLTEREKAIARGEDPDAVAPNTTDSKEGLSIKTLAKESDDPGKDADEGDGGTDATNVQASSTPSDWIDDDVKALAKSYNFTDDQLASFNSADEFESAAAAYEQSLVEAVKAPPAKPDKPASPTKPEKTPATPEANSEEDELDPELFRKEGYDERTVKVVERLKQESQRRQQLEREFEEVRSFAQRQQADQLNNMFHSALDGMDKDRYGRRFDDSGKFVGLDKDSDDRRRKVFEALQVIASGVVAQAQAAGKNPVLPPFQLALKRAENMVFGEELRQSERKKIQNDLVAQARRRRPVASSRAQANVTPRKDSRSESDVVRDIASIPEIDRVWKKFQEENGHS